MLKYAIWIATLIAVTIRLPQKSHAQEVFIYRGLCDASAAVAFDDNHFAVADDERNFLQIYKRGKPDPVGSLDLATFLGTKENKESDLEGAAVIGKRVYWISSHGRNKAGSVQERRYRFFATEIQSGSTPALTPTGQPYKELLNDLITAEEIKAYKLEDAAKLPPEAPGGFNIEGLAATPGGGLLIGLRNPIPGGSALLVPLNNPEEVVNGKKPKFSSPIELKLGGRGIRSIEMVDFGYLVIAGPPGDSGSFALYRWSGKADQAATAVPSVNFKDLRPEALFSIPKTDTVQILSDDGDVKMGDLLCKDMDKSKQSFRSMIFKP